MRFGCSNISSIWGEWLNCAGLYSIVRKICFEQRGDDIVCVSPLDHRVPEAVKQFSTWSCLAVADVEALLP